MNIMKSEELTIAAGQFLKERDYWLNKLSGELVRSAFPHDNRQPNTNSYPETKRDTVKFNIPGKPYEQLIKLSGGSEPILFIILAAALTVLLARYTGGDDIIFGTTIEKQDGENLMEGEFINSSLPIRNRIEERMTFKELLIQTRTAIIEAVDNQNYPIEKLRIDLNLQRKEDSPSNETHLFDIALLLESLHEKAYINHLHLDTIITFSKREEHLEGEVDYNPSCFRETTIQRIIDHYTHVLTTALDQIEIPVSDIDILAKEERATILNRFNPAPEDYPKDKTLHRLFEEAVEKNPDHKAVIETLSGTGRDISITYKELNEKADCLAAGLRKQGVGPNTIAALMAEPSLEMIIGIIGILKAEGAYLPIDPELPKERIDFMLNDSAAKLLVTADNLVNLSSQPLNFSTSQLLSSVSSVSSVAYIIYTSGSTGNPKGVMIRHNNIVNQLVGLTRKYDFYPTMNHILLAAFTFDPSVQQIFLPLITGGRLHLVSKSTKTDARKLLDFLVSNRIDVLNTVPSLMDVLLNMDQLMTGGNAGTKNENKPNLKYIILAGEIFSRELYRKITGQIKSEKIINIYGPTEATINTTLYECNNETGTGEQVSIPIGKPLMNYNVHILDKRFDMVPVGVPGELCISGEGLACGYLNRPERTASSFIPNRLTRNTNTIYRTGDLARWLSDGNLEFVGRVDHQVKIRGFRVEPGEVDNLLLKHPLISQAVTIAINESGNPYLCSYIVTEGGRKFAISELKDYIAKSLPDYMIPTHIVQLDEIPLTPHGKIDRKALPKPVVQSESKYVAPRDDIEKQLAQLWGEVLGMENIGINDIFFNIGGDSIKAIKLLNLINTTLKTNFKIVDLYTYETIETLAKNIDRYRTYDDVEDSLLQNERLEVEKIKNQFLNSI